jgi:nicotinamidase-related amidase
MTETTWWAELFTAHGDSYDPKHWSKTNRLGRRPAVLVIDVVRSFTGDEGQTFEEATATYPTACGPVAWEAMPHLQRVLALADERGWPVVYTTGQAGGARPFGGPVKGERGPLGSPMDRPRAQEIPDAIKPSAETVVIAKTKASAFFDTPLLAYLIRQGVDSIIVTGATTSGCVRATVVDSHSHGYPTFVVEEAVFDRSRLSHGVNLFEMNAKYADVVRVDRLRELAEETRQDD